MYGLSVLDLAGMLPVDETPMLSVPILQASNYPNPCNPETTISYSLPQAGNTSVSIYNIKGQLVRQLVNEKQTVGKHEVHWNGKDDQNQAVASGVYLYLISNGNEQLTNKMMLLK
jgi:hypothetical protein